MDENKILLLALYLPQFHPIPENDLWWGKGFTEWTKTAGAKPLFRSHVQPHLPADLGFCDLRVPEVRQEQAHLAAEHGLSGFCYWHYWFGNGKRLLERPFDEVLASGKPDYPFCLAWANESWTGIWHGLKDKTLIEQMYPGRDDDLRHFDLVVNAFRDKRYIKIDHKPVFIVYRPEQLPDPRSFTGLWNDLAKKTGFHGVYFIGIGPLDWDHRTAGFDDKTIHSLPLYVQMYERFRMNRLREILLRRVLEKKPAVYPYRKLIAAFDFSLLRNYDFIPTILPNWDNSPRSGKEACIFHEATPSAFQAHLDDAVTFVLSRDRPKPKIILIKSWNEWAEGNYLEPDRQWGKKYLDVILEVIQKRGLATSYHA